MWLGSLKCHLGKLAHFTFRGQKNKYLREVSHLPMTLTLAIELILKKSLLR